MPRHDHMTMGEAIARVVEARDHPWLVGCVGVVSSVCCWTQRAPALGPPPALTEG